ncbi:ubiquinol-cytochrome C chaperone, partial [Pseudomonas sp. FW305-130]
MGNKVLGWLTRLLGGERDTVALRLYT